MPTENNIAAQAGDEPILLDAVAAKIAEFYPQSTPFDMEKNQRLARAILRLPFQRDARDPAAQVSPRATADVERVATECMEALAIGYVEFDEDLNENVCADCSTPTGSEWGDHTPDCLVVRARAAIATTKPGA